MLQLCMNLENSLENVQVGGFMRNLTMWSSRRKFIVTEIWTYMLIELFVYSRLRNIKHSF